MPTCLAERSASQLYGGGRTDVTVRGPTVKRRIHEGRGIRDINTGKARAEMVRCGTGTLLYSMAAREAMALAAIISSSAPSFDEAAAAV